jgi:hypothetical protein
MLPQVAAFPASERDKRSATGRGAGSSSRTRGAGSAAGRRRRTVPLNNPPSLPPRPHVRARALTEFGPGVPPHEAEAPPNRHQVDRDVFGAECLGQRAAGRALGQIQFRPRPPGLLAGRPDRLAATKGKGARRQRAVRDKHGRIVVGRGALHDAR